MTLCRRLHRLRRCVHAAQLFKDSTWLRSLHGIPLEAAVSAAHPHPNLARCSAMRRRGGSTGGDGIWTVTESFERSLQARALPCAEMLSSVVRFLLVRMFLDVLACCPLCWTLLRR